MNKKKLIIFIFSVLLVVILFYLFIILTSTSSVSEGKLSSRAKEYLSDNKNTDSSLGSVNTESNKSSLSEEILIEDCYELKIPFDIRRVDEKGNCLTTVYLSRPSGQVTVNVQSTMQPSLDEVPAIMLRDRNPGTYTKSEYDSGGKTYLVYIKKGDMQEYTAFYLDGGKLISIAFSANTNQEYVSDFKKLIDTFKMKK